VWASDEVTCGYCGRSVPAKPILIKLFRIIAPSKLNMIGDETYVDMPIEIIRKLKCKKCEQKSAAFHKSMKDTLSDCDLDSDSYQNVFLGEQERAEQHCIYLRMEKLHIPSSTVEERMAECLKQLNLRLSGRKIKALDGCTGVITGINNEMIGIFYGANGWIPSESTEVENYAVKAYFFDPPAFKIEPQLSEAETKILKEYISSHFNIWGKELRDKREMYANDRQEWLDDLEREDEANAQYLIEEEDRRHG
jgi:hypothetical protein